MDIFVTFLCTAISMAVIGYLCARSAYRCGICDGWDRAQRPNDSLFNTNGVNGVLREFGRLR